jgi:protein O-GlcNAc transferase
MGVPVISVVGEKHVARMGFSLLNRVGIGELAATSLQGYVETATALALDLKRLAKLRSELRLRMQQSSLLDARAVTRDLESMYRRMWSQWCSSTARPRR